MDYIVEPSRLFGKISVYGAKNCALALLGASVLTHDEVILTNCPSIVDVNNMLSILKLMGKRVLVEGDKVSISGHLFTTCIPKDIAKLLRGSSLLLGSMVGRYGSVNLPLPGGCAIGSRPLDIHLEGLNKLGIVVEQSKSTVTCFGTPKGNVYTMRFPSVGATENMLCACCLAQGQSTLINCATEPEIVALEKMLVQMGAKIDGIGKSVVHIQGVEGLHGTQFQIIPDRIVAATYLSCALASGGSITVNCNPKDLFAFLQTIASSCKLSIYKNAVSLQSRSLQGVGQVQTGPYPQFATDMQPLILSLAALSSGSVSIIKEDVFENRLANQCNQLIKMGAEISLKDNIAVVMGGNLVGATVKALDLRGGAGLVVAALGAKGKTRISGIENINRGYVDLAQNLSNLGAKISCS
ncbi:MAG: UDP-N-acetylglucosamine 1-carboxyvinyltransferase [Clostridia bacterium]|nr:UDP-N-acetylglucosamine 1-carboxyvinyltransferase [Clostridia bacterium]